MKKTITITLLLFLFALTGIKAQQGTTATGGTASGSGGIETFSVGQVFYSSPTGTGGKINEGVQQPFEFFIVGTNNIKGITLSYSVYPNPTNSIVNLKIENQSLENLSFQLLDINGKLLLIQKIISTETSIKMGDYANASYFLKIIDSNKELQTIKIIKNK